MLVGIAGIGGIGSNVARHLAQAGVEELRIIDFDVIEESNLNRQFYRYSQIGLRKTDCLEENLKEIAPSMTIEKVFTKIKRDDIGSLFNDCQIVVEGFDGKEMKKILFEELATMQIPMVSASGISGVDVESVTVRRLGESYIIGDFLSDQDDHILYPPKIAMVAARMAAVILEKLREGKDA